MKKNITNRLLLGFSIFFLFLLVLGVGALIEMNNIHQSTSNIFEHPFQVSNKIREFKEHLQTTYELQRELALQQRKNGNASDNNDIVINNLQQKIKELELKQVVALDITQKLYLGPQSDIVQLRNHFFDWLKITDEAERSYRLETLMNEADTILTFAYKRAYRFLEESIAINRRAEIIVIFLLTLGFLFAVFFTYQTVTSITRPLKSINQFANNLLKGNYQEQIDLRSLPQVSEFNELATSLNFAATSIKNHTENMHRLVAEQTAEIDASNQQLRASEQQLRASNQQLRASEQQLRASDQQLRATNQQLIQATREVQRALVLLNKTQEIGEIGGWEIDLSNNKLTWTKQTYFLHDTTPLEYKPTVETAIEFYSLQSRPIITKAVEEAIREGVAFNHELELITSKGRRIWVEARGEYLDDQVTGEKKLIGTFRDITEKKKADKIVRESEDQLQRFEKLESIGLLAGGIAHDFNNLLAGIFGYIDVARQKCETQEFSEVSNYLSKSLVMFHRAKDLSQQLLTFSKGGKPVVKSQNIQGLLQKSAQFALSGSNVHLELSLPSDLWPCDIDESQIGRVIDNIVINSKQAMPLGGAVTVRAENVIDNSELPKLLRENEKNKSFVKISIEDQGTGITPEHLPRIFDPFFTTKQKGHGLGLATVYSIVKKHGGLIDVKSTLGTGTTFFIYLPSSNAIPVAESKPAPAIEDKKFIGKAIVMDDEEGLREVFSAQLKGLGFSVLCASDGDEALKVFEQSHQRDTDPISLVMLDLTIPGGRGGKEVIQELRAKTKEGIKLIAIACSGYADDSIMAAPKEFGFDGAIAKPYQFTDLVKLLQDINA